MSSIVLKVCLDTGTITKTIRFNPDCEIYDICNIIEQRMSGKDKCEDYGLFLTDTKDLKKGVWLDPEKTLNYYMLKDGDTVYYMNKYRNQRLRMLDGTVKTIRVDDSQPVSDLMIFICSKIGIKNHDEYGLCPFEDDFELADEKTGNSTLRRNKGQNDQKGTLERDAKMEQLRKKLKTDDDEQWLERTKTLREQDVEVGKTLLLKRRLYYSDRNIDSRDPIQLNLLYNQARDAILDGTHPVTEQQACHFAGIQCQIQFGDHDPEKHTPQLIEATLSDFLPQHYIKVRGIEKKILKQHYSLSSLSNSGINEHDAKCMYTRTARSLPTYGVTFFLVKEKLKNKKKLVPRLLGINAESVLRLDENTKEILEIWPLHQLHKWAPTTTTFTLDFGDYSLEPYICQTNEALRIMDVLNCYISMILKKKEVKYYVHDQENYQVHKDIVQNYRMNIDEFVTRYVPKKEDTQPSVEIETNSQSCKHDESTEIIEETIPSPVEKVEKEEIIKQIRHKQSTVPKLLNKITSSADYILNCIENNSPINPEDLREAVNKAKEDLNTLRKGLEGKDNKHLDENDKLVLMEQMKLLQEAVQTLSDFSSVDNMCPEKIRAAADTLREGSVKLYFTIVPSTKRHSQLLLASRNSFIIEETESNRRMSQIFSGNIHDLCANIVKIQNQCETVETCVEVSQEDGLVNVEILENLPKIHAALFCLLAAHADEKNVDYPAAVTSLNTISELLPGIITVSNKLNCPEDVKNNFKDSVKTLVELLKNKYAGSETNNCEDVFAGYEHFAKASRNILHCAYPNGNKIRLFENEIIRLTKSVGRYTINLLKNAHNVAQRNSKLATSIDESGIKCAQAGRRLNICSQLSAPCIQDINCQGSMRGAIEGMASSVVNFSSTWQPLKKQPEYKVLYDNLTSDTNEVDKALDNLRNFCLNSIDVDSNDLKFMLLTRCENNNVLVLRNTMNTAREVLSAAESKLDQIETLPKLDTKESEEMRQQIFNSIPIINATMIDLFLVLSDPSEADYFSATKFVRTIASLVPEVSKNAYYLLFDVKSADLKLVSQWLNLIMDIFNTNDFNFSVKKPALIKFGEITAAILHSTCGTIMLDNKTNHVNSVEEISDKIKKLLNQKDAIIQSLDDKDKEHLMREVILKCHDATENLAVCSKIAEPTISHSVCENSILSSSIILIQRLSELSTLMPEGSMYYDEASSTINMLKEFNSPYKIQAIEYMLSHFKKKCDNYTNSSIYQDLSHSIKGIDSNLATLKELSNEKLREKNNSTFNEENKATEIKEIIEEINNESIKFITVAQECKIQEDDTAVKDSIWKFIEDLQLYMNFNDSFEVRKRLNDDIRQLSDAAINIELFERKLKENQDHTTQNGLKSALENGKKNLNEVNNYMQSLNVTKSSMGSTILPVTQEFVDSITLSADQIIKAVDPKNVLKATKALICLLEEEVNAQENVICKKYFENYANQFLTALKDADTGKKSMEEVMESVKRTAINISKDFELNDAKVTINATDPTRVSENILHHKGISTNELADTIEETQDNLQSLTEIQFNAAKKWLENPSIENRATGQDAVNKLLKYFEKLSWELHDEEKNKFVQTLTDSQQMLANGSNEFDINQSRNLLGKIKQLKEVSDNAVVYEVMSNSIHEDTNCTKNTKIMEFENNVGLDVMLAQLSQKPETEYVVSTLDEANPDIKKAFTQHLQLVKRFDNCFLKLLTNVHKATKELNGSKQAEAIETTSIQCVQASTKLCAEMGGHWINNNEGRIALSKAIEEISLSVDKLKSTCKPLNVLPRTKALGKELVNNTIEVHEVLNDLKNFYHDSTYGTQKDIEADSCKKYDNNALVVNLMNAMKIARENISSAEIKLAEIKTLPTALCQEESEIMRKQISNIIATVNAALGDLFLACSGSIEADYLTATNAVHMMAKLIPELSLNVYHLQNKERGDDFSIIHDLLKAYLHLFNNFEGFIVHGKLFLQEDKKIAIVKCGQITRTILQKVCKNAMLEKENYAMNSVEGIVAKIRKLFNNETKIIEISENKDNKNNIRENILRCVHATEHLQICTKIAAPTISYTVCQNRIRLVLLILQQKMTEFMNLIPETSVFYADASNISKSTQEFDFEFKVQAIDNMVYYFKDKCGKVKNCDIKQKFAKAIEDIDNSLSTLKVLSNSKSESTSKINSQSTVVDETERINYIFNTTKVKINRATSMLFDNAIEENKATSIKNNIWELTKDLKLYIHCQDSLDERKHIDDYVYRLLDCALKIDMAVHNFEENLNDTSKQMELKAAKDDAINVIMELKTYINTLNIASSLEPKQIRLYLVEILKRNRHEEIVILSKYVVHRLRDNQQNVQCPQQFEKFAQNISDAISNIEANKIPISEGVTVLKKIANELTEEFELIDGVTVDTNDSVQNEDNENSFIEIQLISATKWLNNPAIIKHKAKGQEAVKNLIDVYTKVSKEMNDEGKSEFIEILNEVQTLFTTCSNKTDVGNCRFLLDKILELKVASEKAIVSILVKNFMQEEVICTKIQSLLTRQIEGNTEGDDENKNKFALKDNINLLLAHLSRLSETEYLVSMYGKKYQQSTKHVTKIQVLGSQMLEKAELHLKSSDNKAIKDFDLIFQQYKESITRVKYQCDQAVDPLMFVRTVGTTIRNNGNMKADLIRTSDDTVVLRLIKRVMVVCDSVSSKTKDTDLAKSLEEAQVNLDNVLKDSADSKGIDSVKIIRRTEELEAVLGGDIVFRNMPENNEPIFMAAHALHSCVKVWSASENDIIEAARKAAVLMAKLSNSISQGDKSFSIMTSKNIVNVSNDVTRLARKLAEECTDIRIRTSLLQASDQLPTISGQLKMLASVKTRDSNSDKGAMTMLVDNAQNLMLSIQQVVNAAAAASVKIQSQRGVGNMKWIRGSRMF